MTYIDPTAIVEKGVDIGEDTAVWSHTHIRGPASIGRECIIGEKTYIAYDVRIGDRVKINAFVYICALVTIENGVMIAAGTIFTNDRFPRATTPDLSVRLPSAPDDTTLATTVREGATIGAGCRIGSGLEVGRFAMVGMGSVVTRTVPDFHLVVGSPARTIGFVCRCGQPFGRSGDTGKLRCKECGRSYNVDENTTVTELS